MAGKRRGAERRVLGRWHLLTPSHSQRPRSIIHPQIEVNWLVGEMAMATGQQVRTVSTLL